MDGEVTTVHDGRRCSETLKEKGPWWTVDLLGTYPGLAPISFFSVSFMTEIIDLSGGQINDPSSGIHTILFRSSQQLPCVRLGPLNGFLS